MLQDLLTSVVTLQAFAASQANIMKHHFRRTLSLIIWDTRSLFMSLIIHVFETLCWKCGFEVTGCLVLEQSSIFDFEVILLQTIKTEWFKTY